MRHVTCATRICDMTVCVTWLTHMCDMTHSYVWHDSLICVTWLTHMCDMTHSYVWHDSFMRVSWFIHVCDMTHSCVWHDSLICVTWLIHMCYMIHFYVWGTSHVCMSHSLCVQLPFFLLKPTRQGFIRLWGTKEPAVKDCFSYLSFKTESCSSSISATWQVVPSQQPGKYRDSTEQLITRSLLPIGLLDLSYRWVRLINRAGVRRDLSNKVARDWNQEEEDVKEKSRPDPWLGCCALSPAA